MDWAKVTNERLDEIIEHLREVRNIKQYNQITVYMDGEEGELFPKKTYPYLDFAESDHESNSDEDELSSITNFSPTPPNLSYNDSNHSSIGVSPPRDNNIKIQLVSSSEFRSGTITPVTLDISSSEVELSPNHVFPEPHKRIRIESPTNFIIRSDSEEDNPRTSTPIPSNRFDLDVSGQSSNYNTPAKKQLRVENSRAGFQQSGARAQCSGANTFRPTDVVHVKPTPIDDSDGLEDITNEEFEIIKREEN